MALLVPLSRFASRVGGGSAFFVRHHSRIMKLEDFLDVEAFEKSVTPPDSGLIQIWSQTAFEVCGDKHRDVARIRDIYLEIPAAELRPRQIVTFVEALLQALPSDDARKSLIRAEALKFRRFELP